MPWRHPHKQYPMTSPWDTYHMDYFWTNTKWSYSREALGLAIPWGHHQRDITGSLPYHECPMSITRNTYLVESHGLLFQTILSQDTFGITVPRDASKCDVTGRLPSKRPCNIQAERSMELLHDIPLGTNPALGLTGK